eukprot:1155995-Pelagomonas_calceolata.AAC.1
MQRPGNFMTRSNPGRPIYLFFGYPTKIPPQDRNIYLIELESCPDTNPFHTLEAAAAQYASTKLRLQSRKE